MTDTARTTMNGKPAFTVPMKTHINFKSHFGKKTLCGRADENGKWLDEGPTFTAGQACAYSCNYCYVDSMQTKSRARFESQGVKYDEKGHFGVVIRNADAVEGVRKQLLSRNEKDRQTKQVIYASPKVDVAANMELVRETVEICKVILELTNWDIRLLSKSNLLPKVAQSLEEWELPENHPLCGTRLFKDRIIYGVSTGTLDDKLCKAIEVGTPLVSKRIESLHWLQDNGFRTFGMLCPTLPQRNELAYKSFAHSLYHAIRADKCEEVWAEVINVRGDSFINTVASLHEHGFNFEADEVQCVSRSKSEWERYARDTFLAHTRMPYRPGQLRFLQYVDNSNRDWWKQYEGKGAVLL